MQDYKQSEDMIKNEFSAITQIPHYQTTPFSAFGFSASDVKDLFIENPLQKQPDGFLVDDDICYVAEIKASSHQINQTDINQLKTYIQIALTKYHKVIGILYNGIDVIVYANTKLLNTNINTTIHLLQNKDYYKQFFNAQEIKFNQNDVELLNNLLRENFALSNSNDRLIFLICIFVVINYQYQRKQESMFQKDKLIDLTLIYNTTKTHLKTFLDELTNSVNPNITQIQQCNQLYTAFDKITLNTNVTLLNDNIKKTLNNLLFNLQNAITNNLIHDFDLLGTFFNIFNSYNDVSLGQVFTPLHIIDFMYQVTNTNYTDHILDATCGSGGFLVRSLYNGLNQSGGLVNNTINHLNGIEIEQSAYLLAIANSFLHHKEPINLLHADCNSDLAINWIKDKKITRVLMNPPYERKLNPLKIMKTVLDSVEPDCICAFLLPNDKLTSYQKETTSLLLTHTLQSIIKLPSNLFQASTGDISIFIFQAHRAQNKKRIFTCYMCEDGLTDFKNNKHVDHNNQWSYWKDYWSKVVQEHHDPLFHTDIWINPDQPLTYHVLKNQNLNVNAFIKQINFTKQNLINKVIEYLLNQQNPNKVINYNKSENWYVEISKLLSQEIKLNLNLDLDFSNYDFFPLIKDKNHPNGIFNLTSDSKYSISSNKINRMYDTTNFFPYVTRTDYNNGIADYIANQESVQLYTNTPIFTIGTDTATIHYQTKPFYSGGSLRFLSNEEINKQDVSVILFMESMINAVLKASFSWGGNGASSNRLKDVKIPLPVTKTGELDFNYMSEIIKEIYAIKK